MSRARTLAGAIGSDGALNVADVAGLAAVASSGSASDLSTGTLNVARLPYTPVNKAGDTISGNLGVTGNIDTTGPLYLRNNVNVLNSAGNGWINIFDRNSGDPYVNNVKFGTYASFDGPKWITSASSSWVNLITIPTTSDKLVWIKARCLSIENNMPSHYTVYMHAYVRHNGSPYSDGWNASVVWDANTQGAAGSSYVSFQIFQDPSNGPIRLQTKNSTYTSQMYVTGVEGYYLSAIQWG